MLPRTSQAAKNASPPPPIAPIELNGLVSYQNEEIQQGTRTNPVIRAMGQDLSLKVSTSEKGDEQGCELPALQPSAEHVEGKAGKEEVERNLPSEIPDSDAPSPFSSPVKKVREQGTFGGGNVTGQGGDREGKEVTIVVERREADVVRVKQSVEDNNDGAYGRTWAEEGAVRADESGCTGLGTDAESKDDHLHDGVSFPVKKSADVQAIVVDGQGTQPKSEGGSAQQSEPLQNSTPTNEDSGVKEMLPAVKIGESGAPVGETYPAIKEGDLGNGPSSPVEKAAHLELPRGDEVDTFVAADSLPQDHSSFRQNTLPEDEALPLPEASTPKDIPPVYKGASTKATPRTEIPASDDDSDSTGKDTYPTPNIIGFHSAPESASNDTDIVLIDVKTTNQQDRSIEALQSMSGLESDANGESDTPRADVDQAGVLGLSTDCPMTALLHPGRLSEASLSEPMAFDEEGTPAVQVHVPSLIETSTSSVGRQVLFPTNSEMPSASIDVDLPDAPPTTTETEDPSDAATSSIEIPGIDTTTTTLIPFADVHKTGITQLIQDEPAETVAFPKSFEEQTPQPSSLVKEIVPIPVVSSLQNIEDYAETYIASSPPISTERMPSPAYSKATQNISFAAPAVSHDEEEANFRPLKTTGKRKATSIATVQSRNQTKAQVNPKKIADNAKASHAISEESSSKDVLFEELKTMKIVRLLLDSIVFGGCYPQLFLGLTYSQASIQARNASLEAEMVAKRAKLEEVTQGLEYTPHLNAITHH